MAQYFRMFPEEKDSVYVYLDPDVIFLEDMDFNQFLGDDTWYQSDTKSYLDVKYIKSKGEPLFYEMCDIVGIDPQLVIDSDENCGGAQYVIKNNTDELWDEIWKTSIPLYKHMKDTAGKYQPKGQDHPIQAWTSEMWTTNWCAWKNGIETKITTELHFNWANHLVSQPKHKIYHNAGVVVNDGKHFSKGVYQSSPFNKEIKCSEKSMSYFYKLEVLNTEEYFKKIVWD
jgi:hypothetical protein